MKTKILSSIFFLSVLLLASCESDTRMPDVTQVAFPKITIDPTSDVLIQGGSLNGVFSVGFYYENDKSTDAKLVVAMNGNYNNVKVVVPSITTFPSAQTLTDEKLSSLFGLTTINAGDYFEVGLDVQMADGKWYPAFNAKGVGYGSGPMNLPGSQPIIKFKSVCALDVNQFVGSATIVDKFWYEGTYTATVEKVDDTHIKIKNYAGFAGDVVVTINPKTHAVVVDKQVYDTNLAAWGLAKYTNPAVKGAGELDACNKKITLNLEYTVDQGSFGSGALTISF